MRSIDNVIEELKQFAIGKQVHFIDNDLTVNKAWLRKLCERIIEERLMFSWGCQGRVNTLSKELMALMKQAGCINVGVGIESGSQALLDGFLKKQLDLGRASQVVRESVEVGLPLHGWFIIGIPTETLEDMEKTIEFAVAHDFATVGFSIGTPWPGTAFHTVASSNNWILVDDWEQFNEKRFSSLKTNCWGPEDIDARRREIIRRFREKGWVVNEEDFVCINPYWGKGVAARMAIWLYLRLGLSRITKPVRRFVRSLHKRS